MVEVVGCWRLVIPHITQNPQFMNGMNEWRGSRGAANTTHQPTQTKRDWGCLIYENELVMGSAPLPRHELHFNWFNQFTFRQPCSLLLIYSLRSFQQPINQLSLLIGSLVEERNKGWVEGWSWLELNWASNL